MRSINKKLNLMLILTILGLVTNCGGDDKVKDESTLTPSPGPNNPQGNQGQTYPGEGKIKKPKKYIFQPPNQYVFGHNEYFDKKLFALAHKVHPDTWVDRTYAGNTHCLLVSGHKKDHNGAFANRLFAKYNKKTIDIGGGYYCNVVDGWDDVWIFSQSNGVHPGDKFFIQQFAHGGTSSFGCNAQSEPYNKVKRIIDLISHDHHVAIHLNSCYSANFLVSMLRYEEDHDDARMDRVCLATSSIPHHVSYGDPDYFAEYVEPEDGPGTLADEPRTPLELFSKLDRRGIHSALPWNTFGMTPYLGNSGFIEAGDPTVLNTYTKMREALEGMTSSEVRELSSFEKRELLIGAAALTFDEESEEFSDLVSELRSIHSTVTIAWPNSYSYNIIFSENRCRNAVSKEIWRINDEDMEQWQAIDALDAFQETDSFQVCIKAGFETWQSLPESIFSPRASFKATAKLRAKVEEKLGYRLSGLDPVLWYVDYRFTQYGQANTSWLSKLFRQMFFYQNGRYAYDENAFSDERRSVFLSTKIVPKNNKHVDLDYYVYSYIFRSLHTLSRFTYISDKQDRERRQACEVSYFD